MATKGPPPRRDHVSRSRPERGIHLLAPELVRAGLARENDFTAHMHLFLYYSLSITILCVPICGEDMNELTNYVSVFE